MSVCKETLFIRPPAHEKRKSLSVIRPPAHEKRKSLSVLGYTVIEHVACPKCFQPQSFFVSNNTVTDNHGESVEDCHVIVDDHFYIYWQYNLGEAVGALNGFYQDI